VTVVEPRAPRRIPGYRVLAQLNVVTLGVRDLPRLHDFYTALGWEVAIEADNLWAFRVVGVLLGLFPWDKLAADG
jgi:catechol 2,3-dioxygenase-like lactoylglutathione lyase family enzyme